MNFISGLFNKPSTGVGIHPGMTGGLLSGVPVHKGPVLKAGISMDQVLAERLGAETMQPSLVLGLRAAQHRLPRDQLLDGLQLAYLLAEPELSGPAGGLPLARVRQPVRKSWRQADLRSILDAVREDAAGLSRKVASTDRSKLDEYLTSVREVEKRVAPLRAGSGPGSSPASPAPGAMDRPPRGLPEDLREHMKLMCDVVALAFQTDRTRVASLLLCRDLSGLFYPFLDVRDAHHPASHRDLSDDYERVSRYYCGQLAYLATRLDSMREGEGTVLDNSCLLFLSNMWAGWKHDNTRLPVLTVGGLGGTLRTGRVLDYYGEPDDRRKLCSLYLSIMDRMGVSLGRFGDADTRLAGI